MEIALSVVPRLSASHLPRNIASVARKRVRKCGSVEFNPSVTPSVLTAIRSKTRQPAKKPEPPDDLPSVILTD